MAKSSAISSSSDAKASRWALLTASFIVSAIGLAVIAACLYGFATGDLNSFWRDLTDAQASLIAGVCTIYAAAFASVVAPTLFGGQLRKIGRASEEAIAELKSQSAMIASEQQEASQKVLDIAEQSKASLVVLQNYALHMMGFVERFTEADIPNARNILEGFQNTAAILCQEALANSNRWSTTKAQFDGKWPGRPPYIHKLCELGIITTSQKEKLLLIADSRRYTRDQNADAINLVQLNLLNKAVRDLKDSFSEVP